jgi:outer membrane protein assembly factor BamB
MRKETQMKQMRTIVGTLAILGLILCTGNGCGKKPDAEEETTRAPKRSGGGAGVMEPSGTAEEEDPTTAANPATSGHPEVGEPPPAPRKPGDVLWSVDLGEQLLRAPAVDDDGTVYVCGGRPVHSGKTVFAVATGGKVKWKFVAQEAFDEPAIVLARNSSRTVIAATEKRVYALTRDGNPEWALEIGQKLSSLAWTGDAVLVSNTFKPVLYRIGMDGKLNEFCTLGESVRTPRIGRDGTVFVASDLGDAQGVAAFTPDGKKKWTYECAYVNGEVTIGADGTLYVPTNTGGLHAVAPDGSKKWVNDEATAPSGIGIAGDGTLLAAQMSGIIAVAPDGTKKWSVRIPNHEDYTPAVAADGTVYAASRTGLYALTKVGTVKWRILEDLEFMGSPTIGDDGVVYVGTRGGKLLAIYDDNGGGPADSSWPMYGGDRLNSGQANATKR